MSSRSALLRIAPLVCTLLFVALPAVAHATGIPFFGPIIPNNTCLVSLDTGATSQGPFGLGTLAQTVNNIVALALTLIILFVAPFMIVWAGFLYVFTPSNPGNRSKANGILLNTAVGIAVAVVAWLVINLLLTTLTFLPNSTSTGDFSTTNKTQGGVQGFTQRLFGSGSACLSINISTLNQAQDQILPGNPGGVAGETVTISGDQACANYGGLDQSYSSPEAVGGLDSTTGGGTVLCKNGTTVSTVVAAGSTLSDAQACVGHGGVNTTGEANMGGSAVTCEDGTTQCTAAGATTANDCTAPAGSTGNTALNATGTGACDSSLVQQYAAQGGYTLTNAQANTLACIAQPESQCGKVVLNYNWNNGSSAAGAFQVTIQSHSQCFDNAVCEQAAGTPGTPLNCKSGFSGGNPIPNSAVAQRCTQAAANIPCSTVTAACVLQSEGFNAWTADPHGAAPQKQCIATNGG